MPRREAKKAHVKALEFLASAEEDLRAGRCTAAGPGAIHAGISAADTALIGMAGRRSTSQNHGDVIDMLQESVEEFTAAQRRQLVGLVKMKNAVAYEQRPLSEVEAKRLVDHAQRLVKWSGNLLSNRTDDS